MCITMIFMTFDDFLNFDNIQKKWIEGSPLLAIVKAWLKQHLKAETLYFFTRKILLKIFDFFFLIHTLLWCTTLKKIFAVFHQKMSKNADFWKLKNLFQCYIFSWLMIIMYQVTRHFKAKKLHFLRKKLKFWKNNFFY